MPQGYTLGTSRASAGVQDKSNVVSRRLGCRNSRGSAHQMHNPLLAHLHRERWNLAVRGCAARKFRSHRGAQQDAGIGIHEKKRNSS